MPDDEILEPEVNDPEPTPDDVLQDEPGFESYICDIEHVTVESEPFELYEPLYIDRIKFSDKTYTIRDSEARNIINILIKRIYDLEQKINSIQGG